MPKYLGTEMSDWKFVFFIFAMCIALLCWRVAANEETKISPRTKQGYVIAQSFNGSPQWPFWRIPPPRRVTYLRPRTTAAAHPVLPLDVGFLLTLFYAFSSRSRATPAPEITSISTTISQPTTSPVAATTILTTATTTTTTAKTTTTCEWEDWSACSAPCGGSQSRATTCGSEIETRDCNTETGFQPDNWYRAANCLEYFVVTTDDGNYEEAKTHCENLEAQLASTGLRDTAIRREIMAELYDDSPTAIYIYVGAKRNGGGSYDWTDGTTNVNPTFWDVSEPDSFDCVIMVLGSAQSGHDSSCNTDRSFLCEREIELSSNSSL